MGIAKSHGQIKRLEAEGGFLPRIDSLAAESSIRSIYRRESLPRRGDSSV